MYVCRSLGTRQERTVTSGRWETGEGSPARLPQVGLERLSGDPGRAHRNPELRPGNEAAGVGRTKLQEAGQHGERGRSAERPAQALGGADRSPGKEPPGRVSARRAQRPATKGQECPCPPEGGPPDPPGFGSHQSRLGNALVPADSAEKQDLKRSNCFQAPELHPQNKAHAAVETEDAPVTAGVGQPQRKGNGNVAHDAAADGRLQGHAQRCARS